MILDRFVRSCLMLGTSRAARSGLARSKRWLALAPRSPGVGAQLRRGDVELAPQVHAHARGSAEADLRRDRLDLEVGVHEQRLGGCDAHPAQLVAERRLELRELSL